MGGRRRAAAPRQIEHVDAIWRDDRREHGKQDQRAEERRHDERGTTAGAGARSHAASRVRGSSAYTAMSARRLSTATATEPHIRNAISTV